MTRLRIVITGAGNHSKEQRTSSHLTSTIPARFRQKEPNEQQETLRQALWLCAAAVGVCAAAAMPATAVEKPKYGGTLTYMIPEDSPPSSGLRLALDGTVFMLGATYGHVHQMLLEENYAPYNFFPIF